MSLVTYKILYLFNYYTEHNGRHYGLMNDTQGVYQESKTSSMG